LVAYNWTLNSKLVGDANFFYLSPSRANIEVS